MKERGGAYMAGVAPTIKSISFCLEHQPKRTNGPGFGLRAMPDNSCPCLLNYGH